MKTLIVFLQARLEARGLQPDGRETDEGYDIIDM